MSPLSQGSLSDVDHYAFTDPTTLRWRSRSPPTLPSKGRRSSTSSTTSCRESFSTRRNVRPRPRLRVSRPVGADRGLHARPDARSGVEVPHARPPGSSAGRSPRAPEWSSGWTLDHSGGVRPAAVRHGTSRGQRLGLFLIFLVRGPRSGRRLLPEGIGPRPLPRRCRLPRRSTRRGWRRRSSTLRPERSERSGTETIGAPEVAAGARARLAEEKKIELERGGKKLTMRLSVPLS